MHVGRLRFNLSNPFIVLSLMLAVAVGVLWPRSYSTPDVIYVRSRLFPHDGPCISSHAGELSFLNCVDNHPWTGRWIDAQYHSSGWNAFYFAKALANHRFLGTSIAVGRGDPDSGSWYDRFGVAVVVPHWAALAMLLVAPTIRLLELLLGCQRASGVGRCANCGYDLRATPALCPECGRVPAPAGFTPPPRPPWLGLAFATTAIAGAAAAGIVLLHTAGSDFVDAMHDPTTRDPPLLYTDAAVNLICGLVLLTLVVRYARALRGHIQSPRTL